MDDNCKHPRPSWCVRSLDLDAPEELVCDCGAVLKTRRQGRRVVFVLSEEEDPEHHYR